MDEDAAAWLRLALTKGIGPVKQRRLLNQFGLPEHIFNAGRSAVSKVIGNTLADRLLSDDTYSGTIEATLRWAKQPDNHLITLADKTYPPALLHSPDPPILLYAKGNLHYLQQPSIAIVGARSATPQGQKNAHAFAQTLAQQGWTIVSGLAEGIDAAAHRGALDTTNGTTVAVVGTGIDRVYPASHYQLAHDIARRGVIISEFHLSTPPKASNFPKRNRLIAALSQGTLVVEAARQSGSLITARLCADIDREVFAIPGSIHSPLSKGCHQLIKEGAKLVESAEDILVELSSSHTVPIPLHSISTQQQHHADTISIDQTQQKDDINTHVLTVMGYDPVDIDTLITRSGLTLETLYTILLTLEIEGQITKTSGSRFQRI